MLGMGQTGQDHRPKPTPDDEMTVIGNTSQTVQRSKPVINEETVFSVQRPQLEPVKPTTQHRVQTRQQEKEIPDTSLNTISFVWFSGFVLSAILLMGVPFAAGLKSTAEYLWSYFGCLIAFIATAIGSYMEYDSYYKNKPWLSKSLWNVDWDEERDVARWVFGVGFGCIVGIFIIGAIFYGGSLPDESPVFDAPVPVIVMGILYAFWHGVFVLVRLAREHIGEGVANLTWMIGIVLLTFATGYTLYEIFNRHETELSNETVAIANNAEEIDLDLPSGTIWASCNLGAASVDEDGLSFCFGNLESKEEELYYDEDNDPGKRFKDGESIIGTEYDVATVKWGKDWQLPSKEQFEELIMTCKFVIREKGYEVIGPTGKKMFLPYSKGNNHIGYYWSGIKSKVLEFQPGNNTINQEDKPEIRENFATYCQLSIRPVKSRGVARYNLKE